MKPAVRSALDGSVGVASETVIGVPSTTGAAVANDVLNVACGATLAIVTVSV